jgi:DNA replication protein DnaC
MPKREEQADKQVVPVSKGGSPVSKKVLTDYYEFLRNEGERDQKRRIAEVIRAVPAMETALRAESDLNSKMMSLRPGDVGRGDRERLREERARLEETKRELLEAGGFPADYINRKYKCGICKDTGYTNEGMVCSCAKARAEEAFRWIGDNSKSE